MTKPPQTIRRVENKDFFLAKEKLGLLSVGDPGAGDRVHVTDTFLVSLARKVDNRIKTHPELKRRLVRLRRGLSKIKTMSSVRIKERAGGSTEAADMSVDEIVSLTKDISFREVQSPRVSIIIPAFNKVAYTLACLRSLSQNLDPKINPSFEVVLVNNGSSDHTRELKKIKNLVFVDNKENLGFVGGCNEGLHASHGEYVIFLNNDAEVDKDWLVGLYDTIESSDDIGIVGSKIIYPNGVLQEAGGIIFKDADGLNYGKFDQADAYQYNYVRDVDYCSGASIIIRRKMMNDFGGFDTLYQPAYYEDTDLSFKVRQAGLRVVYQPKSVIYHIEGGTAGTNTNSGFKKFQVINRQKFLDRWKSTLEKDHVASSEFYAGRDRSGNKLALIIEEAVPTPDKDSGSRRMVGIIKGLQNLGYKVTFWPNNLTPIQPYTENLQQMGVEVVYGQVDFMQFAKLYGHAYNLVIMSRPEICARYINIARTLFTNAALVYDTVDLHYLRLSRQATIERSNAEFLNEQARWYESLEKGLMERVDATLVVSESELKILKTEGLKNIYVVSNIHEIDPDAYKVGYESREDIIFVGNYAHLPNRDAVLWLQEKIMPLVQLKLPKVKLHVVGANMPDDLANKAKGKNAIIDGYVSDEKLRELLIKSRVFVAPLRYGAGVKGKVGQAIEYGVPTVSTTIAAEGMFIVGHKSGLIADDAETFSEAIITLYNNPVLWGDIQKNAMAIIEDHFSLHEATRQLKKLLG